MFPVYVAFGSNEGDRKHYIDLSVKAVDGLKETELCRLSSLYETEPWGNRNQKAFINQVGEYKTSLSPHLFLASCQEIECSLGRSRKERWGPRTIDIDLLLFGESDIRDALLQVPHPRLWERRFVLVPLAEVAPDFFIPSMNADVQTLLERCPDRSRVEPYQRG